MSLGALGAVPGVAQGQATSGHGWRPESDPGS
ncbi:hypothetical protein FHR73_000281 [Pseudomonas sp. AS2.8]|nr:hypothetical protein [Pseudomonas sp. AS2.8]